MLSSCAYATPRQYTRIAVQGNCSAATTRAAAVASSLPALAEAAAGACVLEVGDSGLLLWSNDTISAAAMNVWLHGVHVHAGNGVSARSTVASRLVSWQPVPSANRTLWLSEVTLQGGAVGLAAGMSSGGAAVYAAGARSSQ